MRVASLDVPAEVIVERAAGRLLCRDCSRIHHREFAPPQIEGECDGCSGELYRREDDQPDVVRERLAVYEEQTRPLVAYYQERGILENIDGNRERDDVFVSLKDWLERVF